MRRERRGEREARGEVETYQTGHLSSSGGGYTKTSGGEEGSSSIIMLM